MVWQLHYTSVEAGPTGRAGFQYVAESPGVPAELGVQITSYLTYRPPPSLPTAPTPEQISAMPVAMAYGPVGDRSAVTRCVYLGQDYSGRFGNFLGHALVLDEDDLVGLRPIELWRAPLWADAPAAPGSTLPELAEPAPGAALDPESIGQWLRSGGEPAYQRLSALLELARRILTQGHGRLVLVDPDCEQIVRWIAAISYSLPWEVARRLSFVTYSGDPAATAQIIVGTTPDVWLPADLDASVVRLDQPPRPTPVGRFAGTVTDLWRRMNLDGIDELGTFGGADPETAAAVIALCVSGVSLSDEEQARVALLVREWLPHWVWPALGGRAGLLNHELARAVVTVGPPEAAEPCLLRCAVLALRDPGLPSPGRPVPDRFRDELARAALAELDRAANLPHLVAILRVVDESALALPSLRVERAAAALVREDLADLAGCLSRTPPLWWGHVFNGLLAGLEHAPPALRARLLTPEVCAVLADHDLRPAPRTGIAVAHWLAGSKRRDRVDVTAVLLLYDDPMAREEREGTLRHIWERDVTAGECRRVVDIAGPRLPTSATLSTLPGRIYVKTRLKDREAVKLAQRVVDLRIPGCAWRDSQSVLLTEAIEDVRTPEDAAALLRELVELTWEAEAELAALVRRRAAAKLAKQDPRFRTRLVKRLTPQGRQWLVSCWLAARAGRDEQAALLEIAIRLRQAQVVVSELEDWAAALVNGGRGFAVMESRFKNDPDLHAGLKGLVRPKKWGFSPRGGRP
ncbi:hypothetical protein [Nonomuraea lactucae]|uniref:GAP1-N2 domain-containing protein n=1 Tax=Nonomuraea lactucae TaxID=2249762 RepID=UPI0013B41101|nr:hypothetical protein [Nonomuraea lactucae]